MKNVNLYSIFCENEKNAPSCRLAACKGVGTRFHFTLYSSDTKISRFSNAKQTDTATVVSPHRLTDALNPAKFTLRSQHATYRGAVLWDDLFRFPSDHSRCIYYIIYDRFGFVNTFRKKSEKNFKNPFWLPLLYIVCSKFMHYIHFHTAFLTTKSKTFFAGNFDLCSIAIAFFAGLV